MATQLQQTSKFELVPLSPAIGVEARGLDITKPLDGETRQLLRQAWAENSILLVRTDGLTEDEQFAYARNFGDIADRVQPPVEKRSFRADPTNRMQLVTDEVDEEGKPKGSLGHSEMWFHTDKCYIEKPHRASFLYAVDIPTEGGHTKFASLYNAYDRLPPDLKNKLDGRKVLQLYDYTSNDFPDLNQNLDDLLHYWQPLFVTNPDTGRKAVYVSRLMSVRIEGMDDDEGRAVLDEICDIIEAPDNIYDHRWIPGDIMLWDNLSSLHARTDWPQDQRRTLRRVTIKGDRLS
ncbi:MAG: TauD/TfdA family dioxygenase [Rhodospirillaceae bacterium]|jgi:taurine dioxygenase|nr:TauD/TfdA family dioxygenase [Rhodospirillaceae bacterium]MBT5455991.1 TauD/TfdA family dioxygenase [Rhodospirillaceae bacterium]